jgi:glycerol-3-phosphate O-acyltransferase
MRDYVRQHGLDFRALDDGERHQRVAALGAALMDAIGRITPVLPVALVATVLLRHPENPVSELDLKSAIHTLMLKLERSGAHIYIPRADHDYAITVGLRMLTLRRVVTAREGLYTVAHGQLDLLGYYANSIAHLVERADVAMS